MELSELTVVTVSKPRSKENKSSTVPEAVDARGVVLKTLPPVLLDVRLPPTYPFTPPEIRTVHVTQSWLSFTSELYDHLWAKWENGEGVLYTWVEWIRSGEFLEELDMISNENGQRTLRYVVAISIYLLRLLMCQAASRTSTQTSCFRHWKTTTVPLRRRDSHKTRSNAKYA